MSATQQQKPNAVRPPPPIQLPNWMTISIAGGAGMFGWLFTHPFEMIKNTNMMANQPSMVAGAEKKAPQTLLESFQAARKKGLYTGLSSGMLRQCVYAPLRLGCYPIFRDMLKHEDRPPTLAERAIAGASAGVFASAFTSPIEVCLVLQTTSKDKPSILTAASTIYRNSGIAGYWSGMGALASRTALVGVCQVAVHDQVLTYLRHRNHLLSHQYSDPLVVNCASVITALVYSFCTMPFEFARVRMSAQASAAKSATGPVEKKYRNVMQAIALVAKEEGVLAMYEAFVPYFGRCAVHTVTCFFAIEYMTRLARNSIAAKQQDQK